MFRPRISAFKSSHHTTPPRRGVALLWAVVLITMIAVIAAVVAPSAIETNDATRVRAAAVILRNVAASVRSFAGTVTRGGAAWQTPHTLTDLTTQIVNGNPADCNSGGNQAYNNTSVANWNTNGPYGQYVMPSSGTFWTPIGGIELTASSSATTLATARAQGATYFLQIQKVNVKLARLLDVLVDATPGAAADTVQYGTVASDSTVLLSYQVFLPNTGTC